MAQAVLSCSLASGKPSVDSEFPPAAGRDGSTSRRPYQQQREHSPAPTPPSQVSVPHAAAPAAGRDGMTLSACRGPRESCRYRDTSMAPRLRRSAAVGRSRAPVTHTTWLWWNIYPSGGTGQHVTALMAAARSRRRSPPPAPPPPFTATGYHRSRTRNQKL